MRNRLILSALASILLVGCSTSSDDSTALYEDYYNLISANTTYVTSSTNYSLSAELVETEDSYAYYVIVDEPQVAMYNVKIMAIANDVAYEDATAMMPSIGIFDGPYHLVPNQVNVEEGYAKGLTISGESDNDSVNLSIMVEWCEDDEETITREFHHIALTTSGMSYIEASIAEGNAE